MYPQASLPNPLPYFESLLEQRLETKNKPRKLQDIIMITLLGLRRLRASLNDDYRAALLTGAFSNAT